MDKNLLNGTTEQPEEGGIDILELLFSFLRNWYWFVLSLGITITGAWLYLRYSVPVYRVSGNMVLQDQNNRPSLNEEAVLRELGGGFRGEANLANEMQVLQSRSLMREVVDSLGIHVTYTMEGRLKDTEVYGSPPVRLIQLDTLGDAYGTTLRIQPLDQRRFSIYRGEGDTLLARFNLPFHYRGHDFILERLETLSSDVPIVIRISHPASVARSYANKLDLRPVDYTYTVAISLNDPVAQKAVDIINTLVEIYNQNILEDKLISGRKTLQFIDDRLEYITRELYDVEKEVENFKRQNEFPTGIEQRAGEYLSELNEQDRALIDLELELSMLDDIETFLQNPENRLKPLPMTAEVFSGALGAMVGEYNRLIFERERLLSAATPDNPVSQQSMRELDYLRDNILLGLQRSRQELEKRKAQLEKRVTPIERRIQQIPASERELLQIMRQQQIKESLYLFLFQKREETAITLSAQVANSKLIDPPIVTGRVSPNEDRIYLLALLLGLAVPGGVVLLRNFLDNKVYSEREIKAQTNTPFLGAIGQPRGDAKIVVRPGSRSSIAEMFRLLRTNLQFISSGADQQIVLVTSGVSGEGKTFISANLAASMALSGKRTVVVGLDLRKPKLAQYLLEEPPMVGVTNFLVGEAEIADIIVPTGMDNYALIASGPMPPNPAEMLIGERIDALFAYLKEHFDCIVVDTAPVGLVTDALLLKDHVRSSIYVVRFGKTVKGSLRIIDEIYQEQKLPNCSIVLNGVQASRGRYGYGYGHGYGYGYGYYQEDEQRNGIFNWKKRVGS